MYTYIKISSSYKWQYFILFNGWIVSLGSLCISRNFSSSVRLSSLLLYVCMHALLLQSCLALCGSVDHSPPYSSVHGILQARILEWVAIASSRGSFPPRDWTQVSCSFCIAGGFLIAEPPRKPIFSYIDTQIWLYDLKWIECCFKLKF